MTQISNKQWETIIDVIHTANAHLEEFDTFRKQTLKALRKAIRTDSASFFLFDDNMTPFNPVALNLKEKYLHSYENHFFRFNHFDPKYGRVITKPAIADSNLFQFSDFKKSYIYNEFFKPQEIQRQLVLYLKSNKKLLGFIGLHRNDEKARFKDWELAVAKTVSPLLSQSLEKAQVFQKNKSNLSYFQTILNRTTVGVLILNFNLEQVFINEMAKKIFARMKQKGIAFHFPNDQSRCMPLVTLESCLEFKTRLPKVPYPLVAPTIYKTVKLSDNEVSPFSIELLDQSATGIQTPLFLVIFNKELSKNHRINEQTLKNEFGLTKREIELVHYLYKGLKNHEIAELLFITEGTVKNHLRNIFDKIGVTTRTSLIYEILSL